MRARYISLISLKYLLRYRKRYRFLFLALAFGFAVIITIGSVTKGVSENLYLNAQSHYAGDIVFLGLDGSESRSLYYRRINPETRNAVYQTLRESKVDVERIAERTLFNDDANIFFAGESLFLRYLHGVDWKNEAPYFEKLRYAVPPAAAFNEDSIIISVLAAQQLRVKQGDSVLIEMENRFGQKNTQTFNVEALINDSSLFGLYKAYISKAALNSLLGFDEEDCSSIGIFLKKRSGIKKDLIALHSILQEKIQSAPLVFTSAEFRAERQKEWEGIKVFLLTMPVYLSELYQLIEAVNLLAYFLYAVMFVIILVSAGVTYRLILHERERELGTMMSIGFSSAGMAFLLGMEALFLGSVSILAGFIFARIITAAFTFIPFYKLPGFEILLSGGKLGAVFDPLAIMVSIVAVYLVLFIAVSFPVREKICSPLRDMLSGGVKG
ncbi:MAG: ABC transporter permease [Spirochaetaceae bacterium]|jgi:ABC-type lipoprotein release transport system permease subunit|nr:ABC transporter permease [Spirochaetaceae bacterium]